MEFHSEHEVNMAEPVINVSENSTHSEQEDNDDKSHHAKLTVFTCCVFLVGEMAGSGVLALPSAADGAGWIGFVVIVVIALISAYTGDVLGRAWNLVQERYPEYRGHIRHPYPIMGQVTYGKPGRYLVSFCINFTMFGGGVVYILLASENIHALLQDIHKDISFCYWLMVVAGVLAPIAWLGTPSDFWPVAIIATTSTSIACIILCSSMIKDISNHPHITHNTPGFTSFFAAFGTICFAFGGHPAFPTFQTDMKDHRKFGKSCLMAYLTLLALYLPVSMAGYFTYGDLIKPNILKTVSRGPMLYIVQILITLHLFCGFIIVINPVSQELEEILKVPKAFTWRRCAARTLMVGCVLFVAESIPVFGSILSLVGGSTVTTLAYVCPPLFYLKLCSMEGDWKKEYVPLHVRVIYYEIVLVGLVSGFAATYSAILSLTDPHAFTVPCYVNITAASATAES